MNPAVNPARWNFWSAWNRFWFLPADPIPLGLMRIIAGALALYIHLEYCLELNEFFGPQGWFTLEAANRERREQPYFATPLDWESAPAPVRFPETPYRRQAIFDFLRRLPDDPAQRMNRLIFITTLYEKRAEIDERRKFLTDYAELTVEHRRELRAALESNAKKIPLPLPSFMTKCKPAQALEYLAEADGLLSLLPPVDDPGFAYVLDWFRDQSTPELLRVMNFIEGLPRSRAERAEIFKYMEFWHTDPRLVYAQGKPVFSQWFHIQDPDSMKAAHGIALIIFFLFTIGLWTRVTSVLSWIAALGYIHRTTPILFGMDTMMSILLFYLMIGPSGAALSIDRLRARFRAARAIEQAAGKPVPWAEAALAGPRPSIMANVTLRAVQIHFCLIYASTGLAKLKGGTWWDANAGWMTLVNPGFSLIHRKFVESMLLLVAEVRPLLAVICGLLVLFTLGVEILLPILVWTRLRPYLVVGSIMLHSGIAFLFGLTPFGLLMMTLLLSFFSAATIRQAPAWIIRRGQPFSVRYDPSNPAHRRAVSMIRALDVAGQVTLVPAAAAHITLLPSNSNDLATALPKALVLLKPFAWVPGLKGLMSRMLRQK